MGTADTIRTRREDAILHLVIDRPEKRNALDRAMLGRLADVIEEAACERAVRAVVLSGTGPVFSAGVDLGMLAEDVGGSEARPFRRQVAGMQTAISAIERLEKPVIAALHGHVVGLALELALACDARVAGRDARLGLPEVRLGLVPDVGGTTRLVRVVGSARAKELILTGRLIDAERAAAIGLVTEVVDAGGHLEAAVTLAREMVVGAPLAVGLAKRLVDLVGESDKQSAMEIEVLVQSVLRTTRDAGEAAAARRERRTPRFEGR
jgi:enoyl-CoA hydratase/carnithine racemase